MKPACHAFREALHDPHGSLEAHAAACADCAAFAARAVRAARALTALEHRAAPPALDGLVVASLQAGARQDRAVRVLEELAPQQAPAQIADTLDARTEFAARHPEAELRPLRLLAPSVLERLVAEELADPAAARARRFAGNLERLEAPAELDQRVARELARGPARAAPRGRHRRLALAAAAVILVTLLVPSRTREEPPRRHLQLQAASLGDLDALGPYARGWIGGLGGGLVSTSGGERR